jgi:hypothetical protein
MQKEQLANHGHIMGRASKLGKFIFSTKDQHPTYKRNNYKEYWKLALVMSTQFLFTAFQSFETVPFGKL